MLEEEGCEHLVFRMERGGLSTTEPWFYADVDEKAFRRAYTNALIAAGEVQPPEVGELDDEEEGDSWDPPTEKVMRHLDLPGVDGIVFWNDRTADPMMGGVKRYYGYRDGRAKPTAKTSPPKSASKPKRPKAGGAKRPARKRGAGARQ